MVAKVSNVEVKVPWCESVCMTWTCIAFESYPCHDDLADCGECTDESSCGVDCRGWVADGTSSSDKFEGSLLN